MRESYLRQLEELYENVKDLGLSVEAMIAKCFLGMFSQDQILLNDVSKDYHELHDKNRRIQNDCMQLLLLQQPVAGDLRKISSTLNVLNDLERIASHARESAELQKVSQVMSKENQDQIQKMAAATLKMVNLAMEAFLANDFVKAEKLISKDDSIDHTYHDIKAMLIHLMRSEEEQIESLVNQLMIVKYLERIADHACHIARCTIYIKTGNQS